VRGDVLDPEALGAAMDGCDLVYHAAGANAFCLRDPSPLFEVNVRGSENVVRAAAQAGVRRIVYTSSAATLGEKKGTVASEETPHRGRFLSNYERSKFEAERVVLAAAEETGIEVVSVNPASVQGPGRGSGRT
jgi:dihydroflavonol-4-reductase